MSTDNARPVPADARSAVDGSPLQVSYRVQVVTGSDSSACSSFRVFGVLHCSSGKSSDRVQLDNCVDRLHAFESGRVDAFELTIPPLPATICGLTISVDNVDASSAWDLQQIIVTDISRNSSHTFPNSKPLGIHHSNELLGHRKTKSLLVEGERRASYYDFSASQPGSTAVSKTVAPVSDVHTKPDHSGILWVETAKFKLCSSCRALEHCWERVFAVLRGCRLILFACPDVVSTPTSEHGLVQKEQVDLMFGTVTSVPKKPRAHHPFAFTVQIYSWMDSRSRKGKFCFSVAAPMAGRSAPGAESIEEIEYLQMQQWILAIKSVVITNSPLPLGRLLRSEVILSTIFGERINNKSFRTLADFELILCDLLPVNGSTADLKTYGTFTGMQLHDFLCGTLMEEHKALALDICIYLLHMNAIVPQAPAAKDSKAKDPKRKLILTSKKDFHPDNLFRFLRHHHFLESRDPNAPLFGCLLFSPEELSNLRDIGNKMFCDISEHSLDVRMRLRGVLLQASKFGSASSSNCTLFRDALYWVITEKKEFFTFLPSAGAAQERLDDVLLILEQYRQWAETDGADCTSLWGVMCALVKRLIKFSRMVDVLASNSFTGQHVIIWLLNRSIVNNGAQAAAVGHRMMRAAIFQTDDPFAAFSPDLKLKFEGHFLLEKSAAIASSSYFDKRSQPSDAASLPRISSAVSSFGHKQTISSVNKCARSGSLDETATYSRLDQVLQTYVHNADFVDNYVIEPACLLQLPPLSALFSNLYPSHSDHQVEALAVDRHGDTEAEFMTTDAITTFIFPGHQYTLKMEDGTEEYFRIYPERRRFTLADDGVADDHALLKKVAELSILRSTLDSPVLTHRPSEQATISPALTATVDALVALARRDIFPPANVLANDRISTDRTSTDIDASSDTFALPTQVSDAGADVVTLFPSTKKSYIASGDVPPHVSFTARWLDPIDEMRAATCNPCSCSVQSCCACELKKIRVMSSKVEGKSNVLGQNGILRIDEHAMTDPLKLVVPGVEATADALACLFTLDLCRYGALLIQPGQTFEFDAPVPLPVCDMRIGEGYVDGYIRNPERGGGFYLEYHDRPHFHLPRDRDAEGYLILGKVTQSSDPQQFDWPPDCTEIKPGYSTSQFALTAFRIPFGTAVYTGPNVLHNDSYLIGAYSVVYTVTSNYSTCLLRWGMSSTEEALADADSRRVDVIVERAAPLPQ